MGFRRRLRAPTSVVLKTKKGIHVMWMIRGVDVFKRVYGSSQSFARAVKGMRAKYGDDCMFQVL